MVRGFYAAASGMLAREKALDVISNNIANAATPGYKNQTTLESTFGDHYVARLNSLNGVDSSNIGKGTFITVNQDEFTDMTQGSLEDTGRNLDMAISGKGFFVIDGGDSGELLARNGQFTLDKDRYLTLEGVGKVLDQSRAPIQLTSSNFTVNENGVIYEAGEEGATLLIGVTKDGDTLKETGNGCYQVENNGQAQTATAGSYKITQKYIEKSNIDISKEMTKIMANQNHFQSCVQILKIYDRINEMSVNQIGKVG